MMAAAERRARAWNALELGPRWVLRHAGATVSWKGLRDQVVACKACRLCETRSRTVFGTGSPTARWMLVGEAPGAEEDATGEPFVGPAGQLLDRMLAAIDLDRQDDTFIVNTVKCRPPGNRTPQADEMQACAGYLREQIRLLQPDLILALGKVAAQGLLAADASMAQLRGRVHWYALEDRRIPVVCTYHPAYLLRSLPEKRKGWEDLLFASDVIAGRVPADAAAAN